MKIIYNNIIPLFDFVGINIFGILFIKKEYKEEINEQIINHEMIHTAQMKELLYIFFYIVYFLEWIIRLFITPKTAYKNISFEKEAYNNQNNLEYLNQRKHFAQWRKK